MKEERIIEVKSKIREDILKRIHESLSNLSTQLKIAKSAMYQDVLKEFQTEPLKYTGRVIITRFKVDDLDIENNTAKVFLGFWEASMRFEVYMELQKRHFTKNTKDVRGGYKECIYKWAFDSVGELTVELDSAFIISFIEMASVRIDLID